MATLFDILYQGKKVDSSTPIKLPIVDNATIYGFVAYNENLLSDIVNCPPLGVAFIVANRAVFYFEDKFYRFPIFSSISKPVEDKYHVYLLHVPRLLEMCFSHVNAYLYCMKNNKLHKWISKVEGIKVVDNKAYYYPKEDECLFESSSQFRAIANSFVVITRRITSENENVIYEVWNPNEIEILE